MLPHELEKKKAQRFIEALGKDSYRITKLKEEGRSGIIIHDKYVTIEKRNNRGDVDVRLRL